MDGGGRRRGILVQVIRDTAGPDVESGELERVASLISDHAAEFFAEMEEAQAAGAAGFPPPDPPWLERPWIDRLAALTVPVVAVVLPKVGKRVGAVGETSRTGSSFRPSPGHCPTKIVEVLEARSFSFDQEHVHQVGDALLDGEMRVRAAQVRTHPAGGHQHERSSRIGLPD